MRNKNNEGSTSMHTIRTSKNFIKKFLKDSTLANTNSHCSTAIPFNEFEKNPNTLLITTSRGGHFGYLEGLWPTKETWMNRLNRQLLEAFKTL